MAARLSETERSLHNGWIEFRRNMPIVKKWAYFDHAAVSPLPASTAESIRQWCQEAAEQGNTVWPEWSRRVQQVRVQAASLMAAEPEEIALVPNTTTGIGLVAEGFPWRSGDNVVTLSNEFPTNQYPWMNLSSRGVETRRVEPDEGRVNLDRIADACDSRTRIVSLSWVSYLTGWRVDLREVAQVAHDAGALLFVDAIQGLGVFPLNLAEVPIDFLAADGHKWMLGPEGAGVLFVRRDRLDLLRPLGVGWNSVVHSHDYGHVELNLRPEAARYEGGSQNMVGFIGLGASLELLANYGLGPSSSSIAERVLYITDHACVRLREVGAEIVSSRDGAQRSGIVAFRWRDRNLDAVRRQCREEGVVLSCRGGCLRISPHAYTNEEDVDRLIQVLRR